MRNFYVFKNDENGLSWRTSKLYRLINMQESTTLSNPINSEAVEPREESKATFNIETNTTQENRLGVACEFLIFAVAAAATASTIYLFIWIVTQPTSGENALNYLDKHDCTDEYGEGYQEHCGVPGSVVSSYEEDTCDAVIYMNGNTSLVDNKCSHQCVDACEDDVSDELGFAIFLLFMLGLAETVLTCGLGGMLCKSLIQSASSEVGYTQISRLVSSISIYRPSQVATIVTQESDEAVYTPL